jgi:hypothetical protein
MQDKPNIEQKTRYEGEALATLPVAVQKMSASPYIPKPH